MSWSRRLLQDISFAGPKRMTIRGLMVDRRDCSWLMECYEHSAEEQGSWLEHRSDAEKQWIL